MRPLAVSELDSVSTVLAGHGIDLGGSSRESGWDDGVAGLSTPWILAAIALALLTVGLLVWMNPSSRASKKLRAIAPEAAVTVVILVPLVAWGAYVRGSESPDLIVERVAVGLKGGPELRVSLGEDDLNSLATTNGQKVVSVECVGRDGRLVLVAKQKWPFLNEAGYDYPHAHQPASKVKLLLADRCRLRGTHVRLEADVKGGLTS
jgi:hypothetical protein